MKIDSEAFWQLLESEHPRAEAFCRRLAGNLHDGDDLYQDSLLRALNKFKGLRDPKAFRSWLYRIIVNVYRSQCRQPWWRFVPLTEAMNNIPAGDSPLELYNAKFWLEKAMSGLSPDERALITLYEIEGWSIAELSDLNNKPEGTIKSSLFRIRKKIRRKLAEFFPDNQSLKSKEGAEYALPRSET